jgi:hypothetical protein
MKMDDLQTSRRSFLKMLGATVAVAAMPAAAIQAIAPEIPPETIAAVTREPGVLYVFHEERWLALGVMQQMQINHRADIVEVEDPNVPWRQFRSAGTRSDFSATIGCPTPAIPMEIMNGKHDDALRGRLKFAIAMKDLNLEFDAVMKRLDLHGGETITMDVALTVVGQPRIEIA